MPTVPTTSTYVAPFTITNREGNALNLATADIEFAITTKRGGGETLFDATDGDESVVVEPDNETGSVEITIPAEVVTWSGVVFEELRVSLGGESLVVSQRSVRFEPVATHP